MDHDVFNLKTTVSKDIEVDGRSGHCGGQSTRTLRSTVNRDTMDESVRILWTTVNQDTMDDSQSGHCGGRSVKTLGDTQSRHCR